jgi:hypothetical protein
MFPPKLPRKLLSTWRVPGAVFAVHGAPGASSGDLGRLWLAPEAREGEEGEGRAFTSRCEMLDIRVHE